MILMGHESQYRELSNPASQDKVLVDHREKPGSVSDNQRVLDSPLYSG